MAVSERMTSQAALTATEKCIGTDVPELITSLLGRAAAIGHGASGIASVAETITRAGEMPELPKPTFSQDRTQP